MHTQARQETGRSPLALLRRLDYLSPWLALGAGFGVSLLLGALLLTWVSPVVGGVAFVALLAGAVVMAYRGEPITVLVEPVAPELPPATATSEPPPVKPQPVRQAPEMIQVPAGTFRMGSPQDEAGRDDHEGPVHEVRLSAFEMMRVPVTRRLYAEVMESEQPQDDTDERPVVNVTWFDAVRFCNRLSTTHGFTPCYRVDEANAVTWEPGADGYRLPTEAEWEYACRANTQTRFFFGDDEQELGRYAWYRENSDRKTHPVGQKEPNPWGLYDMYGNVYEWCWDWYGSYPEAPQVDPVGPPEGQYRVLRGGSAWHGGPRDLRSAARLRFQPVRRGGGIGFRCVRRPRRQP